MPGFSVTACELLELTRLSPLSDMYTLSPYVWRTGPLYNLLVRAVNHSPYPAEKVARIYYGESEDGIHFIMGDHPVIAPGTGQEDKDGCEDPTVAIVGGQIYVYYTGWNQTALRGQLILASGTDIEHLQKQGVALQSTEDYQNPKEATIVPVADGSWRLLFEYAAGGASKIGVASSASVTGPWTILPSLFESRPESWDNWHLSTGPILNALTDEPIMFYNGATPDAKWRIGWVVFNRDYTQVTARSVDPLIVPPPGEPGDSDIAFSASCIEAGDIAYLYYSIADKDMYRATIAF